MSKKDKHLCDSCKRSFSDCGAENTDIIFGIDKNPKAKGKEADKVLSCDFYNQIGEKLRSCSVELSQPILFDLLGLKYLDGEIVEVSVVDPDKVTMKILGNDIRLPNSKEFPKSKIVCNVLQSKIDLIKEN